MQVEKTNINFFLNLCHEIQKAFKSINKELSCSSKKMKEWVLGKVNYTQKESLKPPLGRPTLLSYQKTKGASLIFKTPKAKVNMKI